MSDLSAGSSLELEITQSNLKVLQLTDCHLLLRPGDTLMGVNTENSLKEVLGHLQRSRNWPPDLIVLTGDLAQIPEGPVYQRLRNYLLPLSVPCVFLPGNHDDPATMNNCLAGGPIRSVHRIQAGSWQILCLNTQQRGSAKGHLREESFELLQQTLSTYPDHFTLIAMHHHPVPVGSFWMDTMQLDNGERFLDLLASCGNVKAVIFGHVHQAFASTHHRIQLLSTPSTCFQFKPKSRDFALDGAAAGWRWLWLRQNGSWDTEINRLDHPPPGLNFSLEGY